MKLLKLTLKNFKGIKHFVFEPNGENASIFGSNGTGKTTNADAINWLLFDKDSHDDSKFSIKPLEKTGDVIHGLDCEVEGVLLFGNKTVTLKKTFKEKWTKPRGKAKKIFSGHTTEYEFDGVPKSKKEYDAKTAEIFDEKVFKMLTNPLYFASILPWKERREILNRFCPEVSDDDVIKSDKKLNDLKDILGTKSIEDRKKIIASRKSKINESMKTLPARIDEVAHGMPDISNIEIVVERAEVKSIKKQIAEKEAQITRIESGGEVAEKTKLLSEIEHKLLTIKNVFAEHLNGEIQKQREVVNGVQEKHFEASEGLKKIDSEISNKNKNKSDLERKIEVLRSDWMDWNDKKFLPPENPEKCYACGADIDESVRAEITEKALSDFNIKKSEMLESIDKEGKDINRQLKEIASILKDLGKIRHEIANDCQTIICSLENEKEKLKKIKSAIIKPKDKEYAALEADGIRIAKEIELLKLGSKEEVYGIKEKIEVLESALMQSEIKILDVENCKKGNERINVLTEREKDLAEELEKLESELFLIESFERKQAEMVEKSVNKFFKHTKFKLFETQINGGLNPICEATHNGVPFNSGLNDGARNFTGLDIISTLQEHYGAKPFIFIDNRESIVEIPDMDCQIISFFVSKDDKELRVE